MACKSAINTALTTPTTVLAGGTIPLGAIIRRFGCGMDVNGNGLTICEPGYYDVDVSVTVLPTAATPITATLLRDGDGNAHGCRCCREPELPGACPPFLPLRRGDAYRRAECRRNSE